MKNGVGRKVEAKGADLYGSWGERPFPAKVAKLRTHLETAETNRQRGDWTKKNRSPLGVQRTRHLPMCEKSKYKKGRKSRGERRRGGKGVSVVQNPHKDLESGFKEQKGKKTSTGKKTGFEKEEGEMK